MRSINHFFRWYFGGFCVIQAPFYLVAGIYFGFLAQSSSSWPKVDGTILSSQMVEHRGGRGVSYAPEVRYSYRVNGISYEGRRIWLFGFGNDPSWAEGIASRYPVGASVPVFYKPSEPTLAVLVPGVTEHMLFMAGVALVVTIIGLLVFPGWRLLWRPGPPPNHALQRTGTGGGAASDHHA